MRPAAGRAFLPARTGLPEPAPSLPSQLRAKLRWDAHWLIPNSGERQSVGVHPERVFSRVMDHHGTVSDGTVQQFMRRGRWRSRAVVRPNEQNLIGGMAPGVSLEPAD